MQSILTVSLLIMEPGPIDLSIRFDSHQKVKDTEQSTHLSHHPRGSLTACWFKAAEKNWAS